jgi:hypothetical protein
LCTNDFAFDTINMLRKSSTTNSNPLVSKEEQHGLLRSCKVAGSCSSLDFNPNAPLVSEEMAMDYLAEILVAIFIESKRNEYRKKECGHLLPSFNKGTSR